MNLQKTTTTTTKNQTNKQNKTKMKQAMIITIGLLYKNGQNHEIFIFVYSKLLLNSPLNEFPLIYRPK